LSFIKIHNFNIIFQEFSGVENGLTKFHDYHDQGMPCCRTYNATNSRSSNELF